jgi:hypothetical protein
MIATLLFSIDTKEGEENLEHMLYILFWKKFPNYGNKSMKNEYTLLILR